MSISEKGIKALHKINEFYPKGQFTAAQLSDACGEKFVAATLNSLAKENYLIRYEGSPLLFETSSDFNEMFQNLTVSSQGCDNSALHTAKSIKNDEFYTRYEDIEAELMYYKDYFKDKVVYLPCDDPVRNNDGFKFSEFWSFFVDNFNDFGLKRLIATHYEDSHNSAYKIYIDKVDGEYMTDDDAKQENLKGDGDFRSPECIEIMKECDIICTNPPFSYFREFVSQIMACKKDFLIIGNQNAFTYKEIFPLMRDGKIWTGYNMVKKFYQPDGSIKQFGNVCWFTNLHTSKHDEPLILTKSYKDMPYNYPKYDNYNAINVDRVIDIPKDYNGVMGVPITFLDKICLSQFELIGMSASWDESPKMKKIKTSNTKRHGPFVNGKEKYRRIFIRKI